MVPKRRSLSDRNAEGLAPASGRSLDERNIEAIAEPERSSKAYAGNSTLTETTKVSVALPATLYTDCKAAFLADWDNGGQHDGFSRWVAAALERHAMRTPAERAEIGGGPSGSPRSFIITEGIAASIDAAIIADQRAGRWVSRSAWCVGALIAAVDEARDANGGLLPTPPARLPQQLV